MTTKTALPESRKHMFTILSVDTDINVHMTHSKEWLKFGVSTFRVDTMGEAISQLMGGRKYYFVFINEDSVLNFATQLEIMRDVTSIPIFIFSNSYTLKKKITYIELGADMYDHFAEYAADDVLDALEELKLHDRWAKQPHEKIPIFIQGDVILSKLRHTVFVRDIEVTLTRQEFEILSYFLANSGILLYSIQIIESVWGCTNEEVSPEVLRNAVKRLREKLKVMPDSPEYIETIRDVGYRFLSGCCK